MPTRMTSSVGGGGGGDASRIISTTSRSSMRGGATAGDGGGTSCAEVDEAPGVVGAGGWVEESWASSGSAGSGWSLPIPGGLRRTAALGVGGESVSALRCEGSLRNSSAVNDSWTGSGGMSAGVAGPDILLDPL